MIDFENVQSTVKDLIAAHAYFAGETVLLDDGQVAVAGDPDELREAALGERGFCVTVLPLADGDLKGSAQGFATVDVGILVLIELSKKPNNSVAQKDLYLAVKNAKAALLAYEGMVEQDRFRVDARPFQFSDHDEGLHSYLVAFRKLAKF